MIADVVPPAADLATKLDVAEVRAEIRRSAESTLRWMLVFFVPVWAGTWATVVAVILKG